MEGGSHLELRASEEDALSTTPRLHDPFGFHQYDGGSKKQRWKMIPLEPRSTGLRAVSFIRTF